MVGELTGMVTCNVCELAAVYELQERSIILQKILIQSPHAAIGNFASDQFGKEMYVGYELRRLVYAPLSNLWHIKTTYE